jgi:hypothetical protein
VSGFYTGVHIALGGPSAHRTGKTSRIPGMSCTESCFTSDFLFYLLGLLITHLLHTYCMHICWEDGPAAPAPAMSVCPFLTSRPWLGLPLLYHLHPSCVPQFLSHTCSRPTVALAQSPGLNYQEAFPSGAVLSQAGAICIHH